MGHCSRTDTRTCATARQQVREALSALPELPLLIVVPLSVLCICSTPLELVALLAKRLVVSLVIVELPIHIEPDIGWDDMVCHLGRRTASCTGRMITEEADRELIPPCVIAPVLCVRTGRFALDRRHPLRSELTDSLAFLTFITITRTVLVEVRTKVG